MLSPRFTIISLGNPLPKYASLHSAGHFALNGLVSQLSLPPLEKAKIGKQTCLSSRGPQYHLIQSPTLMNVSGAFCQRAVHELMQPYKTESSLPPMGFVILHDELERDFGDVKLVRWTRSHKGHNGVKSVVGLLNPKRYPRSLFMRIAVGIGRPEERDRQSVSRYVLGQIGEKERRLLEGDVASKVVEKLREMEKMWEAEGP